MHRINKCFIKEHIYGNIYWTTNHAKNMSKLMSQISLMNKKKTFDSFDNLLVRKQISLFKNYVTGS